MKTKDRIEKMAARLAGDPKMEEAVCQAKGDTAIISALEDLRVRKGLRQKDIADRMKVSVSAVSRLEDSCDADLRYGDIVRYANAMGMKLLLFMEDSDMSAAEQIKHCVLHIAKLLKQLTELAKECDEDSAIVDGIVRFRGEVLFNFFADYLESEIAPPSSVRPIFISTVADKKKHQADIPNLQVTTKRKVNLSHAASKTLKQI